MAKSLAQKLLHRAGMRARIEGAPDTLALEIPVSRTGPFDFLLSFARNRAAVDRIARAASGLYKPGALLWIAYPKKSGAIETDLSRDDGWEPLTALDYLPVTIVALDSDWSALRFRQRAEIPKLTRKSVSSAGTG